MVHQLHQYELAKLIEACSNLAITNKVFTEPGEEASRDNIARFDIPGLAGQITDLFEANRENAYIFYEILCKLAADQNLNKTTFDLLKEELPNNKDKLEFSSKIDLQGDMEDEKRIIDVTQIQIERQAVLKLLSIVNKYLDHLEKNYRKEYKNTTTTHGQKHQQSSELRKILIDPKLSSSEKIEQYQKKIQQYRGTQLVEHTSEKKWKRALSPKGKTMVDDSEKVLNKFKPK